MSELKCGVENCFYNCEKLCSKGEICVGGTHANRCDDTCCENFARKKAGMDSFTSSISHPSIHVSIDCEAEKCIYNEHYKCMADHVDISGRGSGSSKEDTCCKTFREA